MLYNFKKNIVKNENNLYSLSIEIPKNLKNINYKIYNQKFVVQSGCIENSKIINKINIVLEKLETIFILINNNNNNIEYFELTNLKDLYTNIIENIKINFRKNTKKNNNNLFNNYCDLLKLTHENNNTEDDNEDDNENEDEDEDEDEDDEDNQIEEDNEDNEDNEEDELEEDDDSNDGKKNN